MLPPEILKKTSSAPLRRRVPPKKLKRASLAEELAAFRQFGTKTRRLVTRATIGLTKHAVPTFVNEFWTARQRAASNLHEISYRACFKPQLPRFFIERLTNPGDVVYDPFMGRGTTPIEAALLGRVPFGNDVNPLSQVLTRARLIPPSLKAIAERLGTINLRAGGRPPKDLLVFYHRDTLREICALRKYLLARREEGLLDNVDEWIAMVALNRLTGHSPGFFSVYTMPPNQAVSVKSQRKINERRQQVPPYRDVVKIILKKSHQLLKEMKRADFARLAGVAGQARFTTAAADATHELPAGSVSLVVTSPPFLDIVDYATDNWLRCWFLGIDSQAVKITIPKKLDVWQEVMTNVFRELHRLLKPGGHVAFEVGEVNRGKVKLEEAVISCGLTAGLEPLLVMINDQEFTKTANCWGVDNNAKGTNTNRIVVFQKKI
ncbi:MAG: methylase domain protein [Verrucomicrobia bacterium]|nr:methylase domain protein [Verrucomicrobiota bacterium]